MSARRRVNRPGTNDRKVNKRAGRRPHHTDKYAQPRDDPDEGEMTEKVAQLLQHFNGREADRG